MRSAIGHAAPPSAALAVSIYWAGEKIDERLLHGGGLRSFQLADEPGADLVPPSNAARARAGAQLVDGRPCASWSEGAQGVLLRGERSFSLAQLVEEGWAVPEGADHLLQLRAGDCLDMEAGGLCVRLTPRPRAPRPLARGRVDLEQLWPRVLLGALALAVISVGSLQNADLSGDLEEGSAPRAPQIEKRWVRPLADVPKVAKRAPSTVERPSRPERGRPRPAPGRAGAAGGDGDLRKALGGLGAGLRAVMGAGDAGGWAVAAAGLSRVAGPPGGGWGGGGGLRGDAIGGLGGPLVSGGAGPRLSGAANGGPVPLGPKANPGPPTLEAEPPLVVGVDRGLVRQVISAHRSQIRYCYESRLNQRPKLEGKVRVRFSLEASGEVGSVEIAESTARDGALEACLKDRVATWRFPRLPAGGRAVITYPFLFRLSGE